MKKKNSEDEETEVKRNAKTLANCVAMLMAPLVGILVCQKHQRQGKSVRFLAPLGCGAVASPSPLPALRRVTFSSHKTPIKT